MTDRIDAVRTNPDDTIGTSGSRADGYVFGNEDEYRFAGEIRNFGYDGSIRVFVNGEEVDPEALAGRADGSNGSAKPDPSAGSNSNPSDSGSTSGGGDNGSTFTDGPDEDSGSEDGTPTPIDVSGGDSASPDEDGPNGTADEESTAIAAESGFDVLSAVSPAVLFFALPAIVALLFACVQVLRRRFGE
ncbi:hypothetical protein BRC68_11365 [Halobacteriales archaeon QH_6_64_20]|nr:MAG: hypothetical protein BRC68_11365 [Halobacteriales archaeon QH_6_64_20]